MTDDASLGRLPASNDNTAALSIIFAVVLEFSEFDEAADVIVLKIPAEEGRPPDGGALPLNWLINDVREVVVPALLAVVSLAIPELF